MDDDDLQDWPLHITTTEIARTFGVAPSDVEAAFVVLGPVMESKIGSQGGVVLTFADARTLSDHFDAQTANQSQ